MKSLTKLKLFFALIPAITLFYGCPVGIGYTLGTPGTEKIDEKLIGTWVTTDTTIEFAQVEISKKDDYSYNITVSERRDDYMITATEFTGWVTEVGGEKFLYSKPTDGDEEEYYLYNYSVKGKTLTSRVASMLVNGSDGVHSTEDYRKEIEASIKMEGGLSDAVTWKKK